MKYLLFLFCLSLMACSSGNKQSATPSNVGDLAQRIPPSMRAKPKGVDEEEFAPVLLPGEKPAAPSGGGGAISALPALPDADDLVWTDPDNPDQNLGSIETVFSQPVNDPWQLSYMAAQRLAFAEGKPLMIWFTDSKGSPTCKALAGELFGTDTFESWSKEKVIKLRVDLNPPESDEDLRTRKGEYAQALRKKFRVKGSPGVLVIGHEGQAVGRYRGYRSGSSPYYFGRIKNAVSTIDEGYFNWRTKMDEKGYRMWEGVNGVELYAKLLKYADGDLLVVEPNGRKSRFNESNLSADDQKWIKKQKAQRIKKE